MKDDETTNAGLWPKSRWSLIEQGEAAFGELCKIYWSPVYGFLRRMGKSQHDAEDITQDFLRPDRLKQLFGRAKRDKGKLRTFLIVALKRLCSDLADKENALKRGGGEKPVSLHTEGVERTLRSQDRTPEEEFDTMFALTLFEKAYTQLRDRYVRNGKEERFELLAPYVRGDGDPEMYASIATQLEVKEGSVRAMVSRLRDEYKEALIQESAQTLLDADEDDPESRALEELILLLSRFSPAAG